MSNQNAFIRHSLNQIRGLIQQQKLVQATASKATRVGDPQQQDFWDKLGLQETALRRLLRQLHQKAVTFEWERTHLWRIPRHQRYPVRQSIDDREADAGGSHRKKSGDISRAEVNVNLSGRSLSIEKHLIRTLTHNDTPTYTHMNSKTNHNGDFIVDRKLVGHRPKVLHGHWRGYSLGVPHDQ